MNKYVAVQSKPTKRKQKRKWKRKPAKITVFGEQLQQAIGEVSHGVEKNLIAQGDTKIMNDILNRRSEVNK